ncbi:MAG: hypothetical protein KGI27_15835, partial [Thaumarchaeota archaeon]|nr:hypothetical protein [Nitrososphaerota archaeon]
KKIPQILRECRKEDMLSFLEAYRDGDGWIHKHSNEFVSSSKKLMDDIHELIIKTGGYCNTRMRVKKGSETTIEGRKMIRKHDVFGLYQWKDNTICLSTKNDINEVFGNIYDLVVDSDTHLIYNRMPNGRSLWSHNGGLVDLCLKENYPVRGVVFSLEEQEQLYQNLRL